MYKNLEQVYIERKFLIGVLNGLHTTIKDNSTNSVIKASKSNTNTIVAQNNLAVQKKPQK